MIKFLHSKTYHHNKNKYRSHNNDQWRTNQWYEGLQHDNIISVHSNSLTHSLTNSLTRACISTRHDRNMWTSPTRVTCIASALLKIAARPQRLQNGLMYIWMNEWSIIRWIDGKHIFVRLPNLPLSSPYSSSLSI